MTTKTFMIASASRRRTDGGEEALAFDRGVNIIVGEPNTGKTRWLELIDFILGDDGQAEEKLGEAIFNKYASASIDLVVGAEQLRVQRRWRDAGVKTKIFVNDKPFDISDFRQLLLERLGIPAIHYPQGNPRSSRTWSELGFRSLFRHLYRRQRFWGDIADAQPTSEQLACILQFLGIAETLYSQEYGDLVKAEKAITDLEARRDSFQSTLNEVSREIVSEQELGVAVTPDAVEAAKVRLENEINDLNGNRDNLVAIAVTTASTGPSGLGKDAVTKMTEEFAELKESEKKLTSEFERANTRLAELRTFLGRVDSEIDRLERAITAGDILSDLKITHCPACDQPVQQPLTQGASQCFLCHQPLQGNAVANQRLERLDFELEQLKGEKKEIGDLVDSLSAKRRDYLNSINEFRNRSAQLAEMLKPVRLATAPIVPPEVAQIEMAIGRRVERIDQLRRIRGALDFREVIAGKIRQIELQVNYLKSKVEQQSIGLDFEAASDSISDGMNEFVSKLSFENKAMWTQKDIQFRIKEDSFRIRVGSQRWSSQLGGTMTIYFFLAYHYSLLKLSAQANSRCPPFLMLDFPPEIEGEKVADHENFVIEPFVELCNKAAYRDSQVIAAGSAFKGLTGVHRETLSRVWR